MRAEHAKRAVSLVGEVGQDGDALAFADTGDPVGTGRGQVVGTARQCRGESHRGRPPGAVAICTFTPCRPCSAE